MNIAHSYPILVSSRDVKFAVAEEDAVATARKGVNAIAKNNAVHRLLDTAQVILDSMSVADQPSLHARLRSDIAALKSFSPEASA
ncbi:MAG TPA: hypothetical protein VM621_10415 [Luteibacter sp.]|uniref:hypothetical protein n=1 Tax=Luteibacter sp. TaxID=1886636 RepID=UPI002B7FA69A|nr:hypothetical protein [Luteibacter sp.]HVI55452.1 hypothetical protein [Luteibacter sp.]